MLKRNKVHNKKSITKEAMFVGQLFILAVIMAVYESKKGTELFFATYFGLLNAVRIEVYIIIGIGILVLLANTLLPKDLIRGTVIDWSTNERGGTFNSGINLNIVAGLVLIVCELMLTTFLMYTFIKDNHLIGIPIVLVIAIGITLVLIIWIKKEIEKEATYN